METNCPNEYEMPGIASVANNVFKDNVGDESRRRWSTRDTRFLVHDYSSIERDFGSDHIDLT
mgnify:FL=1